MEDIYFDENWIDEFENDDKKYDMFNQEDNDSLKINILYINKRNELEKINEKHIKLNTPNKIKKEELIRLIKDNQKQENKKYKLISVLIYNLNLTHEELKNFLRNGDDYSFITNFKNIDDYGFKPTIHCLQEINTLYILFNEDTNNTNNTKNTKNTNNTKRVRFNLLNGGKTRRRRI
jgi:hypothetical protein